MIYKNIKNNNSGSTILETIFYVVLFAILSIAVIDSLLVMTRSFKEATIQAELIQGSNVLERISREIRNAYAINSITTNSLKLDTKDDLGVNKTIEFSLSGVNISFFENDVFIANLNAQNIAVQNLTFTQINTTKGASVKVFLSITSNHDSLGRIEDFYNTIVLRGDY